MYRTMLIQWDNPNEYNNGFDDKPQLSPLCVDTQIPGLDSTVRCGTCGQYSHWAAWYLQLFKIHVHVFVWVKSVQHSYLIFCSLFVICMFLRSSQRDLGLALSTNKDHCKFIWKIRTRDLIQSICEHCIITHSELGFAPTETMHQMFDLVCGHSYI